jgi:hypothetical protein
MTRGLVNMNIFKYLHYLLLINCRQSTWFVNLLFKMEEGKLRPSRKINIFAQFFTIKLSTGSIMHNAE